MKKKLFLSLLAMGIICVNPVNAAEKTAGLPNPMVSYDNVTAAKNAAGFQPLYLPSISGLAVILSTLSMFQTISRWVNFGCVQPVVRNCVTTISAAYTVPSGGRKR